MAFLLGQARRLARRLGLLPGGRVPPAPPPLPLWRELPPRTDLAPLTLFQDITVLPARALYNNYHEADGGPDWPDFDRQTALRHQRGGKVVDRRPPPMAGIPLRLDQPCLWGGYARPHFGHFVAEYATRALISIRQRPQDVMLFTASPEVPDTAPPRFLKNVLDWYGVPETQVRMVTDPLTVAELRVAPQAEQLDHGRPDAAYLDLLAENTARNRLNIVPSTLLYVGREGMLARAAGGHAGEAYLIEVLRGLGVTIMDPARTPLRRQLGHYAGARAIVFSEGSAQHGRQLLGHHDQRILVLNRRRGHRTAQGALAPRCTALDYAEVTRHEAAPIRANGFVEAHKAISFYDPDALFAAFRALGLDLARHWNTGDYAAARRADAVAWLASLPDTRPPLRIDATLAALAPVFAAEGLGDLLPGPLAMTDLKAPATASRTN